MTELVICILAAMTMTTSVLVGYLWVQVVKLRERIQTAGLGLISVHRILQMLNNADKELLSQDARIVEMIQKIAVATKMDDYRVN